MHYIALSDNAARQLIDSTTVFDEFRRVLAQARPYAGGMYWKRQGDYEYLVKTQPDGRQRRIGARWKSGCARCAPRSRTLSG
ncbi:MAG TPA: hypothetical protein VLJ58_19995 [Ramlibacter sp.]|nr:hypothetical protein [Ramlibacter sp.]